MKSRAAKFIFSTGALSVENFSDLNGRRGGRSDLNSTAALTAREHNTNVAYEKSRGEIYFFHRCAFCGKLFAAVVSGVCPNASGPSFRKIRSSKTHSAKS